MAEIVWTRCDTGLAATMGEITLTRRASSRVGSGTLRAENGAQPFKVAPGNVENTTVRGFYLAGAEGSGELYVPEMARSSGANA